ncbi:MAG: PaaI family thioesterase [Acidobacteria bacterium]|nr:PaaI family thioesterase [Acidobacteriota bacterium]
MDTATGCAVQSTLPAGTGYATLSLAINYIRPLTITTGAVRCIGKIVSVGRRVAVSEADIVDDSGRVMAHAVATCILINPD